MLLKVETFNDGYKTTVIEKSSILRQLFANNRLRNGHF